VYKNYGTEMIRLIFLLFCLSCSSVAEKGKQTVETLPEEYAKRTVKMNKDFLLFKPTGYTDGKKFPLIIFLHGSGERGSDIKLVGKHGIPKIAPKKAGFQFIGVSPQCLRTSKGGWVTEDLDALLEYVKKKYSIDDKRIYLTGLSMGGFGTWKWAAKKPHLFAAVAPICGGGNPADAAKYGQLPIWNFHGDADKAVNIKKSEVMVEAVRKAKGNIKYTVYPGVGHDSWTRTYKNPELYNWFLSHSK
jgi:predicted peptidase